jgi:hypothetical protein
MKKSLLFLLLLSSLRLLAGCGSANSAPPPPTPAAATHFFVSSPTAETASTPFNITVTALDASNNVVASYSATVHFTSTDPQAVLPANSPLTNGTGTFSVTLKTASAETVSVSDTASAAISGTSSSINVTGPPATHFSVITPANDTAGTSFTFTVNALDASNNVATGYSGTVHFTSTDSQAVLPANSTLTNGTATFSATLKTIGGQTITATDSVTASIAGISLSINVGGGAASHFSVTAPATATAGAAFNFTVTALDASNSAVASYSGTVHFTSTDSQAVLPANATLTNGVGTFSATLKTAGSQTITATDTVTASFTGTSNSINVNAAAATHFSVVAPATATAGTAFNFTVTALNASNTVVSSYSGTVHFSSTDSQAVLPANATLTNGTGALSATLKTAGSQTITATDIITASIIGTSNSINVNAAAATHFSVVAPATDTAGTAFNFTVTALDTSDAVVSTYTGTVHFSSSDAQAVLPANSTLTNGAGTFSATLKTVGCQTITVTDTVAASIAGTSLSINVGGGAASHFSVAAPATATAGTALNFTVTALNASNNTVASYSGTVHFSSTDSQAVLPANATLTNGTGTFSATLKTAGSQTITATDTVAASITGTSNSINVNSTVATHFSVIAPANDTAGTSFAFTVNALNASNSVVPGYSGTVHFSSTDSQAVLPANSTLTNGTGTFSATLKTVGSQTITATDTVTASITGTSIITVPVPPVTVMVSPPAATVFVGAMQTFTATVTATNTAVTWTVQEGAAGGSITNLGVYTAPQVPGTYHVNATSVADSTKSGSATITVPAVLITMIPATDTLGPGGMRTFVAAVGQTTNRAVTWSVEEGAAGGTVSTVNPNTANYTAPTAQGTFHIVATSVVDPTTSASAVVTVVQSGFLPTGSMTVPRYAHTATLLNTGEALVAGGIASFTPTVRGIDVACLPVATDQVDLFNPVDGTFKATHSMKDSRTSHTATLLQDGRVLVAGGSGGPLTPVLSTAEIFDPAPAAFTVTGSMLTARELHTATLLPSGRVLIAGGVFGGTSAEVFDPAMGTFAATGSMTASRYFHTATLLQTGKVLIVGGVDVSVSPLFTTLAELYDPAAGTFSPTGNLGTARENHTATLLPDGSVLIAGGVIDQTTGAALALSSAEIYNPVTGMFTPTGSMNKEHTQHTATLLPSGKVLISGGGNFISELFDPATGTFSLTGSMSISRTLHAATLLSDGKVVVTGSQTFVQGIDVSKPACIGGTEASAELYH